MTPFFELSFLPYLSFPFREPTSFGAASIWSFSRQPERIGDPALRKRVGEILGMYREYGSDPTKSQPTADIALLSVGRPDLRPLTPNESRAAETLRYVLFLCCVAQNVTMHGPNAGHWVFTSENFDIITQRFTLESDYFGVIAGVIARRNLMGYKLGSYITPTPAYVPRPIQFTCDWYLFRQLRQVKRQDPVLFRRVLRATEVFFGSYYNSPSLALEGRVLLQASAFEVLLNLPADGPRKAFKERIESLLRVRGERRHRCKYEIHGHWEWESRTRKGIWADRFYTLRNHLVHGKRVPRHEYVFRGSQHHLVIAPMMFCLTVKALIDESRAARKKKPVFDQSAVWTEVKTPNDEDEVSGFRVAPEFGALTSRRVSR